MKRVVHIYIEGTTANNYDKIDLFDDEKINISSSIQNVNDIAKVYTDFSQSFTVPATENNNKIFEYFYQNDVDGAIDHNQRRYAYIEVGYVPFRSGKIQLEGSTVRNGKIEFYNITFYGDLVSLKDLFGATKLADLDFTAYDIPYNGTEVKNRLINTTDYDVRFPLISSKKVWTYADASSTDISTDTGKIDFRDLFPAIKVARIFDVIALKWGLTFNSAFLQTNLFNKLFLWCKNTDDLDNKFNGTKLIFDGYSDFPNQQTGTNEDIFQSSSNSFQLFGSTYQYVKNDVTFTLQSSTTPNIILYFDIYVDNVLQYTKTFDTSTSNTFLLYSTWSSGYYNKNVYFNIKSNQSSNVIYNVKAERSNPNFNGTLGFALAYKTTALALTGANNSPSANMPDVSVSDFFTGVLKQFNLTCYSTGYNTFTIEPLDNWYSKGGIIDVTKYIDKDTIQVDRIPLYNKIAFNYQPSQSFINRAYADESGKEYGDITTEYPEYDGGEYNISVPFENLEFYKFTNTPLQVGYSLTKEPDYKSYIPKPILLYYNGQTSTAYRFYEGSIVDPTKTLTSAPIFGQDLLHNNTVFSLNFSSDTSTWYNTPIDYSLFAVYYYGYLSNLFNPKNRLTKVKAVLPIALTTNLKLNDRLVIEDKRYMINSISSDITTGEFNLELIHDFRPVFNLTSVPVNPNGGGLQIEGNVRNGTRVTSVGSSNGGVVIDVPTFTEDTILNVTTPADPNPIYEIMTDESYNILTDDGFILRSEEGDLFVIDLNFTYEALDGSTTTETLYLTE